MTHIVWRFWLIQPVRPLELTREVRLWKQFWCRVGYIFRIIFIKREFFLICDVKENFKIWHNHSERFQLWHLLTIIAFLLLISDRDHCWLHEMSVVLGKGPILFVLADFYNVWLRAVVHWMVLAVCICITTHWFNYCTQLIFKSKNLGGHYIHTT